MNKVSDPTPQAGEENRRRTLPPLLLLLLFLLLTTSCIVGFLLGRTTEPRRFGALIDTIVIAPQQADPTPALTPAVAPSAPETPAVGSPTAETTPAPDPVSQRICLLGVVRYTDGVPFTQGSVELRSQPRYSALDEEGRFRFDEVEPGEHRVTVLDLAGNPLAARTIRVERDAVEQAYMEYEAAVCVMHIKLLTVEVNVELTLEEDPAAPLRVTLVGAREEGGETQPVGQPSQVPTGGPQTSPGVSPTAEPSAGPAETPGPTASVPPTAAPTALPTASPAVTPSPSPTPDHGGSGGDAPKPTPTPTGDTQIYHGESGLLWTQKVQIDLFRPLTGGEAKIAPGSKGYYLFRLKNGRNEDIQFTLALREGSFHVPLEYRLATDDLIPKPLTAWQTASTTAETVSKPVTLKAEGEGLYQIQWRWPPEGDDRVDTALGEQAGVYILDLTIRVEGGA